MNQACHMPKLEAHMALTQTKADATEILARARQGPQPTEDQQPHAEQETRADDAELVPGLQKDIMPMLTRPLREDLTGKHLGVSAGFAFRARGLCPDAENGGFRHLPRRIGPQRNARPGAFLQPTGLLQIVVVGDQHRRAHEHDGGDPADENEDAPRAARGDGEQTSGRSRQTPASRSGDRSQTSAPQPARRADRRQRRAPIDHPFGQHQQGGAKHVSKLRSATLRLK